jgi:hypothetical protein
MIQLPAIQRFLFHDRYYILSAPKSLYYYGLISKRLKKPPYKDIHSVYRGFNQVFRECLNKDPVEAATKIAQEGKIAPRPVKGGATLYLPEDASSQSKGVLI